MILETDCAITKHIYVYTCIPQIQKQYLKPKDTDIIYVILVMSNNKEKVKI